MGGEKRYEVRETLIEHSPTEANTTRSDHFLRYCPDEVDLTATTLCQGNAYVEVVMGVL